MSSSCICAGRLYVAWQQTALVTECVMCTWNSAHSVVWFIDWLIDWLIVFFLLSDWDGSSQDSAGAESLVRSARAAAEATEDIDGQEQLGDIVISVVRWQQQQQQQWAAVQRTDAHWGRQWQQRLQRRQLQPCRYLITWRCRPSHRCLQHTRRICSSPFYRSMCRVVYIVFFLCASTMFDFY